MMKYQQSAQYNTSRSSRVRSSSAAIALAMLLAASSGLADEGGKPTHGPGTHTKSGYHLALHGQVTKIQSGVVFVKTPVGQYTINAKTAPADAAVGDEVTLWLNDENMVIDHHGQHKNKAGAHRLLTGKLVYAGLTKKEIKLWTPEGEKVFPLDRMEVKTKPIAEGSKVTVELDESGTVIDLKKVEL